MDLALHSSRHSVSDAAGVAAGPIALFDVHLRYLNDSYLGFFQERKRIEDSYVESLKKLYRKTKTVDSLLDDRGDLSTSRGVWSDVLANVEREAQTRQAFCSALVADVINPLINLRETQERTRKRIKEDLKDSNTAYTEYAENTLPKLKSRYNKRFTEAEDQKKIVSNVPQHMHSIVADHQLFTNNSRSNSSIPSRPTVTAPQPLRALDRQPSGSASSGRNRSPSSSTAFSDLAHQGKRQLNHLIGFLDKGGAVKDTLGGGRGENQALKNVRARREADEADREYRKGVHWLETLRIRKSKTLESGYTSLELFVEESATVLKRVLQQYADTLTATSTTEAHLSSHARSVVEQISPDKDVAKIHSQVPRSLASAIPEPVLYQHGGVGSCNDLIFGFSLVDYATEKGLQDDEIPKIIRICIEEVDKRGLNYEGIYRISGRLAVVQTLQHDLEKDETSFEFQSKHDIHAVASLLKLYLRELPEPVFRYPLADRIQYTEDRAEHLANKFALLKSKLRRMPPVHQTVFRALLEHLARVVAHAEVNKMDARNLAIVLGSLFGEDELPKSGEGLLAAQSYKDTLMEDLILNLHLLYDDQQVQTSPPLPPTPLGEPVTPYSYGSKTTKIVNLPGTPPQAAVLKSPDPDHTPKLPSRPTDSIHPSFRTNPTSPSRSRFELGSSNVQETLMLDSSYPPSPYAVSISLDTDASSTYQADIHPEEHVAVSNGASMDDNTLSHPMPAPEEPLPSAHTPLFLQQSADK